MDTNVGVIGLGLMGTAITHRLLEAGYRPCIWNRTRDKADSLIAAGAVWSDCPLAECRRIIISLYSSDVVSEVLERWGQNLSATQIIIDTTTGDPAHSTQWADRLRELGVEYLDAPISGSSEQTRRGEATAIVSGNRAAFDQCEDLWPVLAKRTFHVGVSGDAARMKLVSNLVLGLNRAALAEGLVLAESLGLDLTTTLNVLQGSAAYSRQMDTKGQKMISEDFSVQARLSQHLKDVRLMLETAATTDIRLALTETHRQLLEFAEQLGLGDMDNSAVIQAMRSRGEAESGERKAE
ncbi:MAG: NAD(P)-dependent oxidoreductase [Planctomycetaceae bacterium]|nr:NAD(P)-dependent oxidoreductase [Planctomycetaceae bacterium]